MHPARGNLCLPFARLFAKKLVDKKLQRNFLFHIKYQSFQVFAFGVIYADGVVGGLGLLVQYAHLAAALSGGTEHGQAELLLAHGLRARECEQYAAGGDFLEGTGVEAAVAL